MANIVVPLNVPAIASNQAFQNAVFAPGTRFIGFHAFNDFASQQFLHVYDASGSTSVAFGAMTPLRIYPMASFQSLDIQIQNGDFTRGFTAGIVLAFSSVATSYVAGTSLGLFDLQYL